MAIQRSEPGFTTHFKCPRCNLNYRQTRRHFIIKEICPICDNINYAIRFSFTCRNLANTKLPPAIKTLAEDIAYAVYKDQAMFLEPPTPNIPIIEIDADHWHHSIQHLQLDKSNGGNHD